MQSSQSQPRNRTRIADPVLAKVEQVIADRPPDPPIPDAQAERDLALISPNPHATVVERAGQQHDAEMKEARSQATALEPELDRVDKQLSHEHDELVRTLNTQAGEHVEACGRGRFVIQDWNKIIVACLALLVLAVVSVATMQTLTEESSIAESVWRQIAIAIVPFMGAFLVTFLIDRMTLEETKERFRRAVNLTAIVLLFLWIPLVGVLLGVPALQSDGDIIQYSIEAAIEPTTSDAPATGNNIYLIVMWVIVTVFLDIFAAATFKASIDQKLTESTHFRSIANELAESRMIQLQANSSERAEVAVARARLTGYRQSLDSGRAVYINAVLTAVFRRDPPDPPDAGVVRPNPTPNPTSPTIMTINGSADIA